MKKMIVAFAIAAFASTAMAAIAGSTHDMATQGGTKAACQYCHAPHLWNNPTPELNTLAPLWNRTTTAAAGITAYSRTGGTTGAVSGITRACLSCHDGATGYGSGMLNNADTTLTTLMPAGPGNVGLDLTNDHPVGMNYPTTNTEYNQGPSIPAEFVLLGGVTVECSTCHDVHGQGTSIANGQFLVRPNTATSNFCGGCHIK